MVLRGYLASIRMLQLGEHQQFDVLMLSKNALYAIAGSSLVKSKMVET
jgi:hypothetical protein